MLWRWPFGLSRRLLPQRTHRSCPREVQAAVRLRPGGEEDEACVLTSLVSSILSSGAEDEDGGEAMDSIDVRLAAMAIIPYFNWLESYPFFTFSNPNQAGQSFGFFAAPQKLPPPPPCIEVSFFEPEGRPIKSHTEPIVVGDGKQMITLLKGRVSTSDVFRVSNSDLVPGKYEGGLKLWEGSIDLVKTLYTEIGEGRLTVKGKRVLELGCGHGLPGIFTGLKGAATIHFQDFNSEVLRYLTVPNTKVNLIKKSKNNASSNVRFFAGDWSEVHHLLLHACNGAPENAEDCATKDEGCDGYDIILMAETVYALSSLENLYELIKKCLCRHHGRVYMSGKKHYFGVGGGTRQFLSLVEADGVMKASLLAEVADGSSNVREVWKLSYE